MESVCYRRNTAQETCSECPAQMANVDPMIG